jgi:hypothetical protein
MQLDVIRGDRFPDEWCVTVDGKYVVGFAGPDARERAERQCDELQELFDSADARSALGSGTEAHPDPLTLPRARV